MKTTYYCVVSTGIIHGVYGPALLDMANEKAATIPFAHVITVKGNRPHVGDMVPV